jgi:hypothetical protein
MVAISVLFAQGLFEHYLGMRTIGMDAQIVEDVLAGRVPDEVGPAAGLARHGVVGAAGPGPVVAGGGADAAERRGLPAQGGAASEGGGMMQVLYFAWVRERIGLAREEVTTEAATVADLVRELSRAKSAMPRPLPTPRRCAWPWTRN